ncbi:MAG: hypothetical protein R3C16_08525 [Hyphomonadaceae bacterium]
MARFRCRSVVARAPETDAEARRLRQAVLDAADEGRLLDARARQDELVALRRRQSSDAMRGLAQDLAEGGQISFALGDYRDAARRYAEAADAAPADALDRWRYRIAQGDALRTQGELFAERAALEAAVQIYEREALPLVARDTHRAEWVRTYASIGEALLISAERGSEADARRAITAFEQAVSGMETHDETWGMLQYQLGMANGYAEMPGIFARLVTTGSWYDERAPIVFAHFDQASEVFGPESYAQLPPERARLLVGFIAQVNRWTALGLEVSDDEGSAIYMTAFDEDSRSETIMSGHLLSVILQSYLLERLSVATHPREWATAQMAVGDAYLSVASGEDADVYFMSQRQLGQIGRQESSISAESLAAARARMSVIVLRGRVGALIQALQAFDAALQVRQRAVDPYGWSMVHLQRGRALLLEAQLRGMRIEPALEAYGNALLHLTPETDRSAWIEATLGLGETYVELAGRSREGAAAEARAAFARVLGVIDRVREPALWARAQAGSARATIADAAATPAQLREAVTSAMAAAEIFPRDELPGNWAKRRLLVADALLRLGRSGDRAALARARTEYADIAETVGDSREIYWLPAQRGMLAAR